MNPDQVATYLEAAADLLESETFGWCKWSLAMRNGSLLTHVCAIGALRFVIGGTMFVDLGSNDEELYKRRLVPALEALSTALVDRGSNSVSGFNDQETTTKQDVVDLFKETAKDLRNRS
jgi:hypothetical protein